MRFYRTVAFLLALCLGVGLFSCGEEVDTREFYLYEDDIIGYLDVDSWDVPADCVERGGKLLARKYIYNEEKSTGEFLFSLIDIMSGEAEEFAAARVSAIDFPKKFSDSGTRDFTSFGLMPDGNAVQVFHVAKGSSYVSVKGQDQSQLVITDSTPDLFLAVIGRDGQVVWSKELGADGEVLSREPEIAISDGGYIYLLGDGGSFVRVSPEGETVEAIGLPESQGGEFRMALGGDGNVRFYEICSDLKSGGVNVDIHTFSDTDSAFGEPESFSVDRSISDIIFAKGCEFCYRALGGIYSFDGKASEQLFNWMDFGLDDGTNWFSTMLDTETGFVIYLDTINMEYYSGTLRRVDAADYIKYYTERHGAESAEELKERKTIEIVAAENVYYSNIAFSGSTMNNFVSYMNRFARQNMQYKVKLRYLDGSGSDAAGALMRRMAAGEVPDVIMFNYGLSSGAFAGKDMFEDLYGFIDSDKEHGRDYFLPCVLESFENSKGELPYITAAFSLGTMLGLSENFEGVDWTLDGFVDFASQLPPDKMLVDLSLGGRSESGALLYNLMRGLIEDFVDYDKKECYFENDDFKRLIEVCKNSRVGTGNGYDTERLLSGEILSTFGDIYGIVNYAGMVKGTYMGNDVTMLGYPHEKGGSGMTISPILQFSIFKGCEGADGAWELIADCFDSQADAERSAASEKPDTYCYQLFTREAFPASWDAIDTMLDYAPDMYVRYMHAAYRDKETGERYSIISNSVGWKYKYKLDLETGGYTIVPNEKYNDPVDLSVWFTKNMSNYGSDADGGAAIIEFSEEDIARLREAFETKCVVDSVDEKVMSIILEEAEEYFSGVKSLDDVVRMINDRVTTRINE